VRLNVIAGFAVSDSGSTAIALTLVYFFQRAYPVN
jgi:hypothetical protein